LERRFGGSRRPSLSAPSAESSPIILGYPPGGSKPDATTNHRSGTGSRTVLTDGGPPPLEVPRDRDTDLRAAPRGQA
jgi:hypothetical protein